MTSTEKQEIKIRTVMKEGPDDEPYVLITIWLLATLLRSYGNEYGSYVKRDTGLFYDNVGQLASGELDDHDCEDSCGSICNASGLYTIADRKINEPFWFMLVSLANLTLETCETQEFTLVLD